MRRSTRALLWIGLGWIWVVAPPIAAAGVLPGDLYGDGAVDGGDEVYLESLFGSESGDASYDPAADLNDDGEIDVFDLALFGATFGSSGGDPDVIPPGLFVTLNDVPDDMNDLLVVPPTGFQITLAFDSLGHSGIDVSSLVVTNSEPIGPWPAGTNLASQFTVSPTRAVWEVPGGTPLAETAHFLSVSVRDLAGNEAVAPDYGFAVRAFETRGPLENPNTVHLDFEQDRTNGPENDFTESLRALGLSSVQDPAVEAQVRTGLISEITMRVGVFYGSLGPDPANVEFSYETPAVPHSRICIGGESAGVASLLGSAALDVGNVNETSDECAFGPGFGVFPHAIDNLWSGHPTYQATLGPVDPDLGGIPIGEHPEDATILAPSFELASATAPQLLRWVAVFTALDAFAQAVASATAHEVGHMLGLVAHGDAPGGLYGGTTGNKLDHNVATNGNTPTENFLMNAGPSFNFDEITGKNGTPLPRFRPLAWAYLKNRIVLDDSVTGLFPSPQLDSVSPNPFSFGGSQSGVLTFHGSNFVELPFIELWREGSVVPNPVTGVSVVDAETVTGTVWSFFLPVGTYDVRFVNGDGQELLLPAGLVVE